MAIQFTCSCGKLLKARDEHAGRRTRCPACGQEHCIPDADDTVIVAGDTGTAAGPPRPAPRDDTEIIVPEVRSAPPRPAPAPPRPAEAAPAAPRTSGLAIAAFLLGLLSFCLSLPAGIAAVILGIISLVQIGNSNGRLKGRGLAVTGIVLGVVGSVLFFPILIALLVPAAHKTREVAGRIQSQNNPKQMTSAMHSYADEHGHFPQVAGFDSEDRRRFLMDQTYLLRQALSAQAMPTLGAPIGSWAMAATAFKDMGQVPSPRTIGLSWRVHLLPYIGEKGLYKQFHLNEPWDSPHNKTLLDKMPKVYQHPNSKVPPGYTHYRVFVSHEGPRGVPHPAFLFGRPVFPGEFSDGPSSVILIVEATKAVPWTNPEELYYHATLPLPKLGVVRGGFNAVTCDGEPHWVPDSTPESVIRAAITRDGAEITPGLP